MSLLGKVPYLVVSVFALSFVQSVLGLQDARAIKGKALVRKEMEREDKVANLVRDQSTGYFNVYTTDTSNNRYFLVVQGGTEVGAILKPAGQGDSGLSSNWRTKFRILPGSGGKKRFYVTDESFNRWFLTLDSNGVGCTLSTTSPNGNWAEETGPNGVGKAWYTQQGTAKVYLKISSVNNGEVEPTVMAAGEGEAIKTLPVNIVPQPPATMSGYSGYSNYCVRADGSDPPDDGGHSSDELAYCKARCDADATCTAFEWYAEAWKQKTCYLFIREQVTKGSSDEQWRDAACYVRQR